MKRLILLLCVFVCTHNLFSQDILESAKKSKNFVSSEYNRNSISLLGVDFKENLSTRIYNHFKKLEVPDKFYENPLQTEIIYPSVARDEVSDLLNQLNQAELNEWLDQNKIGQQILSKWFNRQSDGSFNVDILKKRGLFNANDNEFIIASASKRGESSLMDMGLQLVNQSYLIVFDFYNLMTMNQYYDKNETETENRVLNGFRGSLNSYLFKLDFNDSVAAVFFQDYWVSGNESDKESRIAAFENAKFPFVALTKQHNVVSSTQYNPGQKLAPKTQKSEDELLDGMAKTSLESVITGIENRNEAFRVKAMVSDVKPISAKIGKKEGLKFDQRYFVYENRERRNGKLYSKRIGVVKSMKVVDNRNITTGQTDASEFYQIAGGRVDNYGMFLEQHNDVGLNIFLGTTSGGLPGYTGRAEYYISKFLGDMTASGKSSKGLTSIKLYVEGAYGNDEYLVDDYVEDFTFLRGSVGLNKDFYPLNFLHWGPFIGYGIESTTWEDSDNNISTDFIEMGARIGLNLAHNIQLLGSANYYMMLTSEVLDSDKEVINEDFDYEGIFDDRFGPGISLGLRIMF